MHAKLILTRLSCNVRDDYGFSQEICDLVKLVKKEVIYI